MSSMLDIVGSVVLFGILLVTIGRVQVNLNSTVYENAFSNQVQTNTVEFARQIEFDFTKIGYGVSTGNKLSYADTATIAFRSDLKNTGIVDSIRYWTGDPTQAASTMNPLDFPIFRRDSDGILTQVWGTTRFHLQYYDSLHTRISVPITHPDSLRKVRSIEVTFSIEGREPGSAVDTIYYAVAWQKLIYPRNLNGD
jgi:hypothetical protein